MVSQICALLRVENLAAVNFLGKKISTKQTGDSETNSTFHLICNLVHFKEKSQLQLGKKSTGRL